MSHRMSIAVVAAGLWLTANAAQGQVSVFGNGQEAAACSTAARHGVASAMAIRSCTVAIEHENLLGRDLAGTLVNRGVLYLRNKSLSAARADLDVAISIDPSLGEAYINRGAVLIAERQYAAGVADIDKGLTLKPEQPEKAYYNRGLAKEFLDDLKGAYLDYRKAAELAPDWSAPQNELKRFNVAPKPGF